MRSIALVGLLASAVAWAQERAPGPDTGTAHGTVFEDRDRDGVRDPGERGVAGVWVSNQRTFAKTDRQGRWKLPYNDDTTFFVVKPRGWMTPVDDDNVPRFYYVHKPGGSEPSLDYPGLRPTGPLPESVDFPLYRRREADEFAALFFGDTQPRDLREVDYLARKVFAPLYDDDLGADFGVTLGDVVFDDLSVIPALKQAVGLIGLPWYYVIGNHDLNLDAADDGGSDETWHHYFGPNYYSFDHGPVHFVVLDNVEWRSQANAAQEVPPRARGYYRAALGAVQLEWLRQDLATAGRDRLVVALMHIPVTEVVEKKELFALLAERPYALSVSAHTHMQEHRFLTEQDGWPKPVPHHHVINVTTCGSWWSGMPDSLGVPHTTMRDGAPPGYSVFRFDGNQYSIEFRAAGRPESYQMNLYAPEEVKAGQFVAYANVFGGSERSKVEYSFAGGPWHPMERVLEPDPAYVQAVEREGAVPAPFRKLPRPEASTHLWKATVRGVWRSGVLPLHVRTTDMFGQSYTATRAVRVTQ